jgi:hypothetical protein
MIRQTAKVGTVELGGADVAVPGELPRFVHGGSDIHIHYYKFLTIFLSGTCVRSSGVLSRPQHRAPARAAVAEPIRLSSRAVTVRLPAPRRPTSGRRECRQHAQGYPRCEVRARRHRANATGATAVFLGAAVHSSTDPCGQVRPCHCGFFASPKSDECKSAPR